MKTQYKYIYFEQMGNHPEWYIKDNKTDRNICWLEFNEPRKQWVLGSNPNSRFSADCLKDIVEFMEAIK